MGFLEKIGLGPKSSTGAPILGEKRKKEEEKSSLKKNKYIRALILIGFLGILISAVPRTSFKESINYTVGEPWRAQDLTAPFTFALQKNEGELQQERQKIRRSTPPIFHVDHNARINIQSQLDSLFKDMQPVLQSYLDWQRAKAQESSTITNDSLRFIQELNVTDVNLSDQSWQALLENYAKVKGLEQETGSSSGSEFVGIDLKQQLESIINETLNDGILNVDKDTLSYDEITVRDLKKRTERTYSLANLRDLQEAKEYTRFQLSRSYYEAIANAGSQIYNEVIQPNYIYNKQDTQARIDEALSNISETKGAVAQGQVDHPQGRYCNPRTCQPVGKPGRCPCPECQRH
ncbi:MAG: hypothetical protein U5K69_03055 [Balneolaceae bacterium]|nr:hypothetical protein [Balneolaceae bacterium]